MHRRHWIWVGSVVVLAAFFGVGLAQTSDGETPAEEGVCDILQGGTPGLYGLCVAFCEAHDCEPDPSSLDPLADCKPASLKILAAYDNKKQEGVDPNMPCTETCCFSQAEADAVSDLLLGGCYTDCRFEAVTTSGIVSGIVGAPTTNAVQVLESEGVNSCTIFSPGHNVASVPISDAGE